MRVFICAIMIVLAIATMAITDDEILTMYRAQIVKKYHSDMSNDSGRVKWHGKVIQQKILTNELRRIDTHDSGFVFTNKWIDAHKYNTERYKKKTQIRPPMTNGIPVKLAEARMRRYREKTTNSNVTIRVAITPKK